MFAPKKQKAYIPRLTGQVNADFYAEDYYIGEGKSNWDDPYDWEHFGKLFKDWAIFLVTGFPEAKSFLDVGCARGFLERAVTELAEDNERDDLEINGFDFSSWAIENADEMAKPLIRQCSIDDYIFTRRFDVMASLDTFEHLTEEQVTKFLRYSREFIDNAGFFVIALDEEHQRNEPSHINLKTREWWDAKFEECGWVNDFWAQMKTALAMRERFAKINKIQIFVRRPRAGNEAATPYDAKLLELANRGRWEMPEGKENET